MESSLGSATTEGNSPPASPLLKHPRESPEAGLFYWGKFPELHSLRLTLASAQAQAAHERVGLLCPERPPGWAAGRASSPRRRELWEVGLSYVGSGESGLCSYNVSLSH